MYTGHLSTEPSEVQLLLAANGLSYLFYALFLYSLAIGVGTALDAMCAQAHGRGAKAEIIVLLQTAVLCSAVLMIPIFFTCYFATDILLLLGQNPQVADVTGRLLWIMMFGLPFCFGYEIFKRILQSQNIVLPAVYGGVFANVTNVAVAYVLMYRTSLVRLLPRANLAIASNNIFMGFRQVFFMVYMGLGVARLTAQLMAVNAPFQIGFAIWMVMQGVFRGSARPHEGALWNVLAILVVGVPAGWFLASNYEWGILGIWVGISAGYAICAVFGLYWLATVDWVAMAKEASSRLTVDSPSHELLA
ncbi:hypothetical protein DYB32_003085 [Aphanomyces invadans]|uniref:Polysaccharide biosynthesis protein C-terminal domain-containing protein n=1 Tax=Aphanomyces invadans TaxID=157072 RepID=A0A418B1G0_9STRA|nr:hypothetical protein DYB32_003085 [Aphanomyces invadans]